MKLFKIMSMLTVLWLSLQHQVRADIESWNAVDVRIPLQDSDNIWQPSRLNIFTIGQLAPRYDSGLGLLRFSVGPQWDFSPLFSLGLLGDLVYQGSPSGKSTSEYRFNVEPVFRGKIVPELAWLNRTRLEYRYFSTHSNWRARHLLRLNWTGFTPGWIPYVANEVFFEYPQGFNQNRSILGIRHVIDQANQMDIGYMLRWRKNGMGQWDADHILMLFLFFAPPDYAQNVTGGE